VAAFRLEEAAAAEGRRAAAVGYRRALEHQARGAGGGRGVQGRASAPPSCRGAAVFPHRHRSPDARPATQPRCAAARASAPPHHAPNPRPFDEPQIAEFAARAVGDDISMSPRERQLNGRALEAAQQLLLRPAAPGGGGGSAAG
jgi:hypothetical protein